MRTILILILFLPVCTQCDRRESPFTGVPRLIVTDYLLNCNSADDLPRLLEQNYYSYPGFDDYEKIWARPHEPNFVDGKIYMVFKRSKNIDHGEWEVSGPRKGGGFFSRFISSPQNILREGNFVVVYSQM